MLLLEKAAATAWLGYQNTRVRSNTLLPWLTNLSYTYTHPCMCTCTQLRAHTCALCGCMCARTHRCMHHCTHTRMHTRLQARTHARMHARTHVHMHARMHARMHVRMHARIYACMHGARTHGVLCLYAHPMHAGMCHTLTHTGDVHACIHMCAHTCVDEPTVGCESIDYPGGSEIFSSPCNI